MEGVDVIAGPVSQASSIDIDIGISHEHGILVRTKLGVALSERRFVSEESGQQ